MYSPHNSRTTIMPKTFDEADGNRSLRNPALSLAKIYSKNTPSQRRVRHTHSSSPQLCSTQSSLSSVCTTQVRRVMEKREYFLESTQNSEEKQTDPVVEDSMLFGLTHHTRISIKQIRVRSMMNSALLWLALPTATVALVPHQFWNRPKPIRGKGIMFPRKGHFKALYMYFDDRERLQDLEGRLGFSRRENSERAWITSLSDEKRFALKRLLGHNHKSALNLSDEQVEEETLRWVVDTDIVLAAGNEKSTAGILESDMQGIMGRDPKSIIKYESIKDLLIASSCHSTLESLTFLWNAIADALEDEISSQSFSSSQTSNSAKLIVFPKSSSLWDYDIMVTMLEAIQIAQPLLPTQLDLRLDLFHPDFKHSPRMWSPHWHSPFPTVGFTIKSKNLPSIDELDIDLLRGKLDALFQSGDATHKDAQISSNSEDHSRVCEDCQDWFEKNKLEKVSNTGDMNIDWIVQSQESPFQLYRTVWNAALNLPSNNKSASIVVEPYLDSHTLHRVAVTVNAALKRLKIPVRITQVYHPFRRSRTRDSGHETCPPYGMIQLSPLVQKSR